VARKTESRGEKIARLALREYGKGTALPKTRKVIAKALGEDPSGVGLLGTVDPIYYRRAGETNPLPATAAKSARGLAVAVRRRRDGADKATPVAGTPSGLGLVRWETVAASASVAVGRRVSVSDAKALYAKGGGTLAESYAGRGTRVAAPASYAANAKRPAEVAVETAKRSKASASAKRSRAKRSPKAA
jgi:hypothetical protein